MNANPIPLISISTTPRDEFYVTNGTVWVLAIADGILYIGGSFTQAGPVGGPMESRNRLAAFDIATGALTNWNPGADAAVQALVISGTTVYVGGYFTAVGGQARNRIAAIDATTGQISAWNPNANEYVWTLVLSGSTLYAGGAFTYIGGELRYRIAAFDIATGNVTSWNPNADNYVQALAVSGSTVYAAGKFTNIGGVERNYIAALDAATGSATSWNPNANNRLFALAVSGSTVYAGGWFTAIGGQTRNYIAALDATTGSATSWNPNASKDIYAIAVSASTVYAGGIFTSIGGQTRSRIAALDAATGNSTTWDPNVNDAVWALMLMDSRVYAGGAFTTTGGASRPYLAVFESEPEGTLLCPGDSRFLTCTAASAYQWYKDGAILTGETNRAYTATAAGSYTAAVTDAIGCGGTSAPLVLMASASPTGLTNNTAADLGQCADTGVRITWSRDAGDWGDGGSGMRTYDVLRSGTPIQTGIAYGTTTFDDTTGVNGTSYTYSVKYNNGCGLSAVTAGVSAADVYTTPAAPTAGNNGPVCVGETLQLSAAGPAPAPQESFSGPTAPGWQLFGNAVLTGDGGTDPVGQGWLRLTPNEMGQLGSAVYTTALPTAYGIQVTFQWATYGGSGADGIAFYFIDGATQNPTQGCGGGPLGYSGYSGCPGVTSGYVGIGFDEYGNFSSTGSGGGCAVACPGRSPNTIALRGSGSLETGFSYLGNAGCTIGTGNRAGAKTARVTLTGGLLTVEVDSGSGFDTLINQYNLNNVSGQAAMPATVKIGFSGSTGGLANYHEVKNLTVTYPDISGPITYSWTGPNGFTSSQWNPSIPNATTAASGIYSVTVTVDGCTSQAGTTDAFVSAPPSAPTAGNNGAVCAGQTLNLTASDVPGGSYSWTGPNGFTSSQQNPSIQNVTTAASGTYSVIVTIGDCTSPAGTTDAVVKAAPSEPAAGNNGPICAGATLNLTASDVSGGSYSWTGPNGFTSSAQNPTIPNATVAASGTYSVTVTVDGCASPAGTTDATVKLMPSAPTAGNNGPVCPGETLQLSASGDEPTPQESFNGPTAPGWQLFGNAVLTGNGVIDPVGQGWLRLTSNGTGQRGSAVYNIALPTANGIQATFQWATYGGSGADGISFYLIDGATQTPTQGCGGGPLGYSGYSGCPGVTNGYVGVGFDEYGNFSSESSGGCTVTCPGTSPNTIAIRGSGSLDSGFLYLGNTPFAIGTGSRASANTARITLTNGVILIEVDYGSGFHGIIQKNLNDFPGQAAMPATVKIGLAGSTGGSTNYHEIRNFSVIYPGVPGPITYSWTGPNGFTSSAQNPAIPSVTAAASGTYSVTETVSGCTSPAGTTNVVVKAVPSAPTAWNSGPICAGETLYLQAYSAVGGSYAWTGPNGFTSSQQNPTIPDATYAAGGTYSVTVTVDGCISPPGTTLATIKLTPSTPTAGNNGPICEGQTLHLSAALDSPVLQESFKGPTAPGWQLFGNAVLTGNGVTDPVGQGWLRLTSNAGNQAGSAVSDTALQSAYGIQATFQWATYGGSGADGFAFYLLDGATENPTQGCNGGALGYSGYSGCPGITNGYVGIGFDEYGNFSSSGSGGGCTVPCPGLSPNTIALRGSGSLETGFSYLGNAACAIGTGSRAGAKTARITLIGGLLTVEVDSGSGFVILINQYNLNNVSGQAAMPAMVKIGFSGSTGGATNFHEVRNLSVTYPGLSGAANYFWVGPNGFTSTERNPTIQNATFDASGTYYVVAMVDDCMSSLDGTTEVTVDIIPGNPVIQTITDNDGCTQSGITVTFDGGSGALRHDLLADGSPVATAIGSPYSYNPGDTSEHSYVVRAVNGACTTISSPMAGTDSAGSVTAICKDISVVLGRDGTVTIAEDAVDNGSFGDCGPIATYDTDITTFGCADTSRPGAHGIATDGDFLDLGDIAQGGASPRTVCLWVKTTDTDGAVFFSSGSPVFSGTFNVRIAGDGTLGFMGFGNDYDPHLGPAVNDGGWHHVAITYSGANTPVKGYVDGSLVFTSENKSLNTQGQDNYIGKSNHAGWETWYVGETDDIRIWNYAKDEAGVAADRYTRLSGSETGLVAYYALEEGTGQIAVDSSTNHLDGFFGNSTDPDGYDPAWTTPGAPTPILSKRVTLSVTDTGSRTDSCTAMVTVNPMPAPLITGPTEVCEGGSVELDAGAGYLSYLWSPGGATTQTTTVSPASTTGYTVTVNGGTGCPATSAEHVVTVKGVPSAPTAGNNGPICAGSTLNLTASDVPGATYSWTGPNGFNSIAQNPSIQNATTAASGTYSVTVTVSGCTSPAGTTVATVNEPSTPTAGNNGPVCVGETLDLTASDVPGATYSWTGPNGFTSSDQIPSIPNATTAASGTYSVTVTVSGCTSPAGTTLVVVSANPLPAISLSGLRNDFYVTNGWINTIVESNGILYIGGGFTEAGPVGGPMGARNRIAAFDIATGALTAWNPNANEEVYTLAVSGSTVYAGGLFTAIGGQARNYIAALNVTDGQATSWNPQANHVINSLEVSGPTVYAGGSYTTIGGQARNYLAALDASTGSATAWNPNPDDTPYALVVSGSTLYVGGSFTTIGGQVRNRIAAFDITTGALTGWDPHAEPEYSGVYDLAVSGSMVYVGGLFATIGGQTRNNIAAFDISTGALTSWNPDANSLVYTLAVSGSTVYAGGYFTSIGGRARNHLAALNISDGSATAWNPEVDYYVYSLAVSDSAVYAGGDFTTIDGVSRPYLAGFEPKGTLLCPGDSRALTCTEASTFQWYKDGAILAGETNRIYTATAAGSYTAAVTDANGCGGTSDPLVLTAPPPATISGEHENTCPVETVELSTQTGMSNYQWYEGGSQIGGATSSSHTVTATGSYTVSYTDGSGCPLASSAHMVTIASCYTAPAGLVSESLKPDKSGFTWTNIAGADYYRIVRATGAGLALYDFTACIGIGITDGAVGADITGDNPDLGECYYYIIQGYAGNDPDEYLSPAGDGTVVRNLTPTVCDGD